MKLKTSKIQRREIEGYKTSLPRLIGAGVIICATAGTAGLVFYWWKWFYLFCTSVPCHLHYANRILICECSGKKSKRYFVKQISTLSKDDGQLCRPSSDGCFEDTESVRFFLFKKNRFIYSPRTEKFELCTGIDGNLSLNYYHAALNGLSDEEQDKRRKLYGPNYIHVPVDSFGKQFAKQFFQPFYIFQIFSVFVWIVIEYYYFAGAIVIMAGMGLLVSILETIQNQRKIKDMVESTEAVCVVRPNEPFDDITSDKLVPGDIIVIPPSGCGMPCDVLLLRGTVIVDESPLTGESVPVMKTALPNSSSIHFLESEHNRHVLYGGTAVLQARYFEGEHVLACVIRTGYSTAKGQMVSSILYPQPLDFQFERDSYKFIGILAGISALGVGYNLTRLLQLGMTGWSVFGHTFDIVTIVVPPALPAAMTVGSYYASKRLEKQKILCINPRAINVGGSLNLFCFDKTGTLTEDGMNFKTMLPSREGKFDYEVSSHQTLLSMIASANREDDEPFPKLLEGMATCHSLTYINDKLCGDPLEIQILMASGATYEPPNTAGGQTYDVLVETVVKFKRSLSSQQIALENGLSSEANSEHVIGIVKIFPFASSIQRSGVVTKTLDQPFFDFFCKGSPETIMKLCTPETVPKNFHQTLSWYAQKGYRIIAMAHRSIKKNYVKVQKMQREEFEENLTFLGLIIMENREKMETKEVIKELEMADIRTVMITGDNLDTGICVARNCGMVKPNTNVIKVEVKTDPIRNVKKIHYYQILEDGVEERSPTELRSLLTYTMAIDGTNFDIIKEEIPEALENIYSRGTVFARMKPNQKQTVIKGLQDLGYVVGMCGDGANDCGALKAAHVGLSLTDTESSVAAPFTASNSSLKSVPSLIRECRCALVTSFGVFKYMAAYSLIQFASVMILYQIGTNLTDFQFLYIDLFLITFTSAVFGRTGPYQGPLHNKPPPTSLMAAGPVLSLLSQFILGVGVILASLYLTFQQDWFVPYNKIYNLTEDGFLESPLDCHENYAVFAPSQFMYIFLAVSFCKGFPYRLCFLTNVLLTLAIIVATVFSVYLTLSPTEWLLELLEIKLPDEIGFRLLILGISLVYIILSILMEAFLVDYILVKFDCQKKCFRQKSYWPLPTRAGNEGIDSFFKTEVELCQMP
ncbi:polyamine-transporting ATPase 13A2-like isoform X2 [Artemia franciscana]|uniref:polyamine-transporting ATPase 13A2-like isoform X2 n=1 Tax=Artemia franciscana TaxID=6661 RepID=UPI0032DB69EA